MKKLVRLLVVTFILTLAISTPSWADGGAPAPGCKTC
jgi:hypothetical protein